MPGRNSLSRKEADIRKRAEEMERVYAENDYILIDTARALGITRDAVKHRLERYRERYPDLSFPPANTVHVGAKPPDDDILLLAVNAMAMHDGNLAAAARSIGTSRPTVARHIEIAEAKGIVPTFHGQESALKPTALPLPEPGKIKRYILTSAQNDTLIHEPTWNALTRLAAVRDAELIVGTLTYIASHEGSRKRNTARGSETMDYDPRIEPHVRDEMLELAPGLIWNGHTNIIPTAVFPLSGWDNYNGRASSIFPHVKVAMRSIATVRNDPAKLQYTTGAVTKRNYIQRKAGQRAEFDHVYGGLMVEVDDTGAWWVRQLNVDGEGGLYDLEVYISPSGDTHYIGSAAYPGIEAYQPGDVHVDELEEDMAQATWGAGGLVDALKPRFQFFHDTLDWAARSHHDIRDPFRMFEKHKRGRECVRSEIGRVGDFLRLARRPWSRLAIVGSNHDRAFEKWLRDADWKRDPVNAEIYLAASQAYMEHINRGEDFNALKWALETYFDWPEDGCLWVDGNDGFRLFFDGDSLEMGLHGDLGPNGARGSLVNLSKLGRKVCIGHSHSAGIHNGAYQTGIKARLDMDYTKGAPSSWSQTDCIIYPNSKRTLVTWWKGQYLAEPDPT